MFFIYTFFVGVNLYRAFTTNDPRLWMLAIFLIATYVFLAAVTYYINKEWIMRLGVFERIRERRRLAMAAAVAEKYEGVSLFETPEAAQIPPAQYRCGNEACYSSNDADNMYWIDSPPLSPGWYCVRCTDAMRDLDKSERLNLDVFLMVLDYEAGQIDRE